MRSPAAARNLDGVVARLDAIVDDARDERSRLGLFAVLYRRVTRRVAQGIADGEFDDGPRMDRLDTAFANRYFAALRAHLAGRAPGKAWDVAFGAAGDASLIVLQHLLLGINAHINVDLGAAAAGVAPGRAIDGLKRDFGRINAILAELTDTVEGEIDEISPRFSFLDAIAGETDERLAVFSMDAARADAWRLAKTLAATPPALRPIVAKLADEKAALLGRLVAHPPAAARAVVVAVRAAEDSDVRDAIDALAG